VGPPHRVRRDGSASRRRHRGPVGRDPGRSDPRRGAGGPPGCLRRTGLPAHGRPRRHQAGLPGLAGTALRCHRPGPGRRAPDDRLQGARRVAAHPPRARGRRPGRDPRAGLPDLRGRRHVGRGAHDGHRRAHRRGAGAGRAGLGQLPVEPDRPGAARGAPAQGRRLVPRARRPAGVRRVLPRVRLVRRPGAAAGQRAAPRRLWRRPHRDPHRALAVEAVQPGRLPVRLRGRRCSRCARTWG
jgi:hypothetical protein